MTQPPAHTIFVSSTYSDLIPYREAVREAIEALGHTAIVMEDFTSSERNPPQLCYDKVREIFELDLRQTKRVILSGCETGSGGDGENFVLLNRALLGAGAEYVVASLWSVDDEATALLMTTFVEGWGEVDNATDLLQAAMLATRAAYPDPYYWAAFTINGLP